MRLAGAWVLGLVLASPSGASDGVLEINQACAVQTGCFTGDTPGFPVSINVPGSYRLTGNLTNLNGSVDTILVQATVSLDLGGFEIQGLATCTGVGATLSCGPAGSSSGVFLDSGSSGSRVHNGTVRGATQTGVGGPGAQIQIENIRAVNNVLDGISGQNDMIVRGCTVLSNGDDGVDVDEGSLVESTVAVGNGDDGVEVDGPSAVVRGVTARRNGATGIHTSGASVVDSSNASRNGRDGISVGPGSTVSRSAARANTLAGIKAEGDVTVSESSSADSVREGYFLIGPRVKFTGNVSSNNTLADDCGGGICSERRRFYITKDGFQGSAALSACAGGFHMASLWEIHDPSNLRYDTTRGFTEADSGSGPPFRNGWIRTGSQSNASIMCESLNCNCSAWTSNEGSGTVGGVGFGLREPGLHASPWSAFDAPCTSTRKVWCVSD